MATEKKPLAIVSINAHRLPAAKRPTSIFRIALPLVYAGMGIALGTLTGVGMAFFTIPAGASDANSDPAPIVQPSAKAALASAPIHSSHRVAVVRVAEKTTSQRAGSQAQTQPSSSAPAAKSAAHEKAPRALQIPPSKTPAAEKDSISPVAPNQTQPRKHVAHPVTAQPRTLMASAPELIPAPLDDEQMASTDEAKSAAFYSEGDLTVAEYNATAGTIETSDGRTFLVGTTVRASNATSWDDYHSSVHYRCDQEGSCTLERAGAVAPNAKAI